MISVIIPAHNEQAYLPATLEAVHEAVHHADTGEACEIIVVDDASTDRTAAIAAARGARVQSVNLRQISAVRNAGARLATGRFLFFIDADTLINAPLLHAACAAMRHDAVGGGARLAFNGPVTPLHQATLTAWNVISRLSRWAAGCFLFVRRDAFDAVGGYNENLFAAEEIDLSARLHRLGPFGILRQSVTTSPRKLETHPLSAHVALLARFILSRGASIRRREGLDLWYAVRHDPRAASPPDRRI